MSKPSDEERPLSDEMPAGYNMDLLLDEWPVENRAVTRSELPPLYPGDRPSPGRDDPAYPGEPNCNLCGQFITRCDTHTEADRLNRWEAHYVDAERFRIEAQDRVAALEAALAPFAEVAGTMAIFTSREPDDALTCIDGQFLIRLSAWRVAAASLLPSSPGGDPA